MAGDITSFLSGLLANESGGENVDSDLAFNALFVAAAGKPEQQFGKTIVPAEDPDWVEVRDQAKALLERGRDLRVLSLFVVAQLHLGGIPGFAQGVHTVRDLLEQRWEVVHPQLDPEDDNDLTQRSNALAVLADPIKVLRRLRDMPLASSARVGQFSWRDIAITTGVMQPEQGQTKHPESVIIGAFRETNANVVQGLRDGLDMLVADLKAINRIFSDHGTIEDVPKIERLEKMLQDLKGAVAKFAPKEEVAAEAAPDKAVEDAPAEGEGIMNAEAMPAARGGVTAASLTSISTRQDALRLLDLVCGYYERFEPSSPLPLLLRRAIRLANMNFLDTLKDLAPGGVDQAKVVAGPEA